MFLFRHTKRIDMTQLIGNSSAVIALREEIECLKRSDAKVLITGESGVGKEVLARVLHANSPRASGKLVAVNCAGVAESLLESELFGHTKGSFTGAYRDRPGLLEQANHGTIFLDEVGEMSARMQALLLRFLENGEIQQVGSVLPRQRLDVRIISATNRSLLDQVKAGAFRSDLYYRLNVVHLKIPPLRQRRDDILPLTTHFLTFLSQQQNLDPPQVTDEIAQQFVEHAWPGNVRELKNVIERLIVRRSGQVVTLDDFWQVCPQDEWTPHTPHPEVEPAVRPVSIADRLFDRMVRDGESFWSAVYPSFLVRDLTRENLRDLVSKGLRQTRGSYKILVSLFNMKESDYRRFLTFLRKHELQPPFHQFRTPPAPGMAKVEGVARRLH